MRTLYVLESGCRVAVRQESLVVLWREAELGRAALPLLELVLIFGQAQVTTQAMRACLNRNVPIAFLSQMGWCYGRVLPVEMGYRRGARYQQLLNSAQRLEMAKALVTAKIANGRTLLMRQQRRRKLESLALAIRSLAYWMERVERSPDIPALMGLEGMAARCYFGALGDCVTGEGFVMAGRSRRPPKNPMNAMLSFGYQVMWNHVLALVEVQGLDPYEGCLHAGSDRHAGLVSDLIEPMRSPLVDALALRLANTRAMDALRDFEYLEGGCFLNGSGRRKWLKAWVQQMEEESEGRPRWDILTRSVRTFKQWVFEPGLDIQVYRIR